jgi:hypothetical protein
MMEPRAVIVVLICVVGAAALIAARRSPGPADASISPRPAQATISPRLPEAKIGDVPLQSSSQQPATTRPEQPVVPAPGPDPKKAAVTTTAAATRESRAADASMKNKPAADASNAMPAAKSAESVVASISEAAPTESAPKAAATESALESAAANLAPATITGCVERDAETFWLKDTSGEDAPTSRSWRSGFLRKRPARVELLDETHALNLSSYVGQRVAATGTLENREMKARSLQRVAASCR